MDEKPTLPEGASIDTAQASEGASDVTNAPETTPASDASAGKSYELSDIASLLDVDENDLDVSEDGKIFIKTKVDGQEGKAKLTDLRTTHQKQGHLDNKGRELAQQREKAEAQIKEQNEALNQRLSYLENVNAIAINQLFGEYQRTNWDELRVNDPAEFSARLAEFNQRKAQLDQAAAYLSNQRNELNRQESSKEFELLPSRISEWSNPETMKTEKEAISKYMDENKLSPRLASFADGVAVTRKAMLYDKLQSEKPEVNKLVRVAPKVSRPGSQSTAAPKSIEDVFYN